MLLAHSTSLPRRQSSTVATPYADHLDFTTPIHTSFDHLLEYSSQDHLIQLGTSGGSSVGHATEKREGPRKDENRRSEYTQLMQSDQSGISSSWLFSNGKLTPTSARNHQRESSLSSLGSAGPASPYNNNTSHPQVVLPPDSAGETYHEGLPVADQATFYNFSKTPSHMPQESYLPAVFQQNYNLHSYSNSTNYNSVMPMEKQTIIRDDDTMSVPDYGHSGRPSVASTRGSPATPIGDGFEELNRKVGEISTLQDHWMSNSSQFYLDSGYHNPNTVPKLDRTMSDAYNDELYSPNFSFISTLPSQETKMLSPSQHSDIFSQRLQAANNQHLSASTQSPLGNQPRRRSPFRQGSPLAPIGHREFNPQPSSQGRLGTAAHMREQQKAENDARILEEQIRRSSPEQSAPKTISPKDALLDYHAAEEDAAMPLFPPPSSHQYRISRPIVQESQDLDDSSSQQSFASMVTSRRPSSSAYSNSSQATPRNRSGFAFAPSSVPGSTHAPQQYQFVSQQRQQLHNSPDQASQLPVPLASVESRSSGYAPDASDIKKPAKSNADSGTYTCTYHGCTLRFETPAKLQKHKREGHRQSAPLISGATASTRRESDGGSGMTSAALLRNSQAGPHKCERINPSTGKPCNAIFSRPYDLTRHEDTIHNARKQKVHCHLCTEEKTFSRNDALTRHMRVVHPDIDFPGKSRRRV